MIVLIDADSLVYSCCFSAEDEQHAKDKFDKVLRIIVDDISVRCNIDSLVVYHGATGVNFRKEVDRTYKANRTQPKPDFYNSLSNYVKFSYDAVSAHNEEVDDIVARKWLEFKNNGQEVLIVTIDKDYKQLPDCLIFDYGLDKTTGESKGFFLTTEQSAERAFWTQMIVGDSSDNIKGVKGCGKVYAQKLLGDVTERFSMFRRTYYLYLEKYQEKASFEFKKNYKLLKIGA